MYKINFLQSLIYFLKDFCGKLLYLALSTYTIGLWGIGFLVKKAFRAVVNIKNADCTWKDFSYLFMALAVIAQFMVAMIYLVGASEPLNDRLDVFLHGRYIDFFLPILISVGIIEMVESKRAFRNELIILIITVI